MHELVDGLGCEMSASARGDGGAAIAAAAAAAAELGAEADAFFDRRRYEEARRAYGEVVRRCGSPGDELLRELVAKALFRKGFCLGKLGRDVGAIATYDELEAGFGDAVEVGVGAWVAHGLLEKGLTLDRAGRREAEIEAFDRVVGRYGRSVDPATRAHVASALYTKAVALSDLGRREAAIAAVDELVGGFGGVSDPTIRSQVGWSLWRKRFELEALGRDEEAVAAADELVARHDEEADPDLADVVAWCMEHKALRLRAAGETEAELAVYDDLIGRFAGTTDADVKVRLVGAFAMKGYGLGQLGRSDEQFAAYDDLITRFAGDPEAGVRELVAATMSAKAGALQRTGRTQEAMAMLDDALGLLADASEPLLRERVVKILFAKGVALLSVKRHAEAVIVLDSATTAYLNFARRHRPGSDTVVQAILGLHHEVYSLCVLDRSPEVARLRTQLVALLGDVVEPALPPPREGRARSEREIAGVLAELHSGDYWLTIATSDNEPQTRERLADRAVDLYRRTESWLGTDVATWNTPAGAAAMLLRHLADGYAILASWRNPQTRTQLPLVNRPFAEWAIREAGIDEWAADVGYPLELQESAEAVEELIEDTRAKAQDTDPELASSFLAAIWQRELLTALCDSDRGRDILQTEEFRTFASSRVSDAWRWGASARILHDKAVSAGPARLFVAQSYFTASRGAIRSSADLFPPADVVRDLLRQVDGYEWLDTQEFELPPWLAQHDAT
ncbi:MAG: hypothetical protein QOD61_1778 [Solirubrobacteraceae bacterium]|jgi:tetratricopeptide (TPR) repeat protein|nr:hypothetical protein [Solirubrobacteraceae bacterium]